MTPTVNGQWFISNTRVGPMLHARLGAAEENSGKLVSLLRRKAREAAIGNNADLLLVDGSPGIGCPVIASLAGADSILVVAEPTPSGLSDVTRTLELAAHFGIPAMLCVNRADINPTMTRRIFMRGRDSGAHPVGEIPYDRHVTTAQRRRMTVVEHGDGAAAKAIRALWSKVERHTRQSRPALRTALQGDADESRHSSG
jgi:MinD superfamily P-loop ATPase